MKDYKNRVEKREPIFLHAFTALIAVIAMIIFLIIFSSICYANSGNKGWVYDHDGSTTVYSLYKMKVPCGWLYGGRDILHPNIAASTLTFVPDGTCCININNNNK